LSVVANTWVLAGTCEPGAKADPESEPLLIRNVHLLSMASGQSAILERHSVLIHRGKIARIAPDADIPTPRDAMVVDGMGKYLLPGLIDAHVHIWDKPELSAYLASGVTTVRNASGMSFHLDYAREIATGCLKGPRLITTGPILNGPGPNTQPNHQQVKNAVQARAAVREQYKQGYRHLKVYSNLSREAYRAILHEARRLGMTVMGHTPEGVRLAGIPDRKPFQIAFHEVLRDKLVSIEHMESVVWHALYDKLDETKARALARDIALLQVAVTPTLVAHHNLVLVAKTRGQYLQRPGVEWLNPFISELEQETYKQWSSAAQDGRSRHDAFYLRATKIFHEEGVKLLAGTDAGIFTNVPGQSLIDELKLLVSAGLTPLQAIETATRNPASALGMADRLGQIKEGFLADMILVDGNPSRDIAQLQSVSGLVLAGKWHGAASLSQLKRQVAETSYENSRRQIMDGLKAQGSSLE
ncbi:MAG: amidohydrolase family protein, partial [Betaproteobacteria bacterium]|nr:amidohydrolase family protein [Betaproteobacteria bacterium]